MCAIGNKKGREFPTFRIRLNASASTSVVKGGDEFLNLIYEARLWISRRLVYLVEVL